MAVEQDMLKKIAAEAEVGSGQAAAVITLLDDGNTVPFIARYRKEATGELDEVQIIAVRDAAARHRELEKRREAILASLRERELLTSALAKGVGEAATLAALEDLYLPFRPKKRTRGTAAREAGLEPLAQWLLKAGTGAAWENPDSPAPGSAAGTDAVAAKAGEFLDPGKGIEDHEAALAGARDILAERFNECAPLREGLRRLFEKDALLSSRAVKAKSADKEAATYRDYFDWQESARRAPSHRILAVLRGNAEGYLTAHFLPPRKRRRTIWPGAAWDPAGERRRIRYGRLCGTATAALPPPPWKTSSART